MPAQKVAQTQNFSSEKTLDKFFTTTESDKRDNLRNPAVHGAGSVAKTAAQKLPRPKSELSS